MNTHADKTPKNKSQSAAKAISQKKSNSESIFQFVDNRPETVAQRKLQEMVNNSPQAKQKTQLQAMADNYTAQQHQPIQKKENNTGLPDSLKAGIENLSGYSMSDVKVHHNSDKPAQLQAHAYAQGTDIHLGPGQEKHLPHEAWHVVQQKQGRVKPTMQMQGKVNVSDDIGLEREADSMGAKAMQFKENVNRTLNSSSAVGQLVQLKFDNNQGSQETLPTLESAIEKLESFLPKNTDEGAKANPAVEELTKKIKALKQLAAGDDEQAKSAEVAALNNELGEIDADKASHMSNSTSSSPVQKKKNLQVAQRVTGAEIVVGAVIVLGVGLLIRRLFGGNANAAPAPVPVTNMQLIGIAHEDDGSFATVLSTAQLTNVNQRVRYDIRWDAAVVPSGNHLGQTPGQASNWVEDLSQQGDAVGDRNGQMARYFDDNTLANQNGPGGLFFRYMDPIQQDPLNGGSWWFRVQVLGPGDAVLANQEIEVDWRH